MDDYEIGLKFHRDHRCDHQIVIIVSLIVITCYKMKLLRYTENVRCRQHHPLMLVHKLVLGKNTRFWFHFTVW